MLFKFLIVYSLVHLSKSATPIFTTPGVPGRTIPVSETTPAGRSIYRVVAIDADSDILIYSLTSQTPPTPQKFSISSTTGVISTMAEFDVDVTGAIEKFEISVRVTDGSSNIETTMIMQVTDENDNSPVFKNYHVIRENTKPGMIVATIRAEDSDSDNNAAVTYKITGGNTNNAFGIDSSSGVLYSMSSLKYDTKALYELIIEARDGGTTPRSSTTTMTLSLIENLGNNARHIGGSFDLLISLIILITLINL